MARGFVTMTSCLNPVISSLLPFCLHVTPEAFLWQDPSKTFAAKKCGVRFFSVDGGVQPQTASCLTESGCQTKKPGQATLHLLLSAALTTRNVSFMLQLFDVPQNFLGRKLSEESWYHTCKNPNNCRSSETTANSQSPSLIAYPLQERNAFLWHTS